MSKMITLRISEERLQKVDEAVARGGFKTRAAALTWDAAADRTLSVYRDAVSGRS